MSGCLFIDDDAPTAVHVPTFDEILQQPIGLGKYKHKTLQWVLHYDLNYIKWMLVSLPSQGRHMLRNRYNTLDFTALELRYSVSEFQSFPDVAKWCSPREPVWWSVRWSLARHGPRAYGARTVPATCPRPWSAGCRRGWPVRPS